jgi:hypothetical protein
MSILLISTVSVPGNFRSNYNGITSNGLLQRQSIQRVPGTQLVAQNKILGSIVSGSIFSDSTRLAETNSHHKGLSTAVSKPNYSIA